ATAPLVALYGLGLPAMGLALLWGRALLAQQQGRLFFIITLISSSMTIGLDALLYRPYGAEGLALAFSAGALLQALFMGLYVHRSAPAALGLRVLLRLTGTASVLVVGLHFVPQPHVLIELFLYFW
ncbi:hypothetical protein OEZ84_28750, partial [Leclercia adecarboxylata]|uniref:lipid II flippase MurJ n=1 Tax=Leclercia adecarboxylata TaxID=83655 RepID=UPI00234C65D7